ncbi:signal-induced proliferation-associated 1-like protein 1 [Astyanax mexicanus]|uniref:Signal-induced proliferation-associated 1-like protein 1 n=1 Tax=Astyanax mexicanus TaxID=7994 RepID=A0A8T2KNM2_ASTMX|nr:signal-induced proliferation-associated 1-like protein 1 [Astyanax mexicanus]
MTSLKHSPSDHPVVGTVHASEDFYTRSLRLSNGGGRGLRQENAYQAGGVLGVPKMGVRARVADWPPRRDGGTLRLGGSDGETMSSYTSGGGSNSHPKLGTLLSPEDSTMLHNIHRTLQSKLHPANSGSSTESSTHLLTVGDNRGSTQRSTRRIRQRSNSDMTLSELDGSGDSGEDWGSVGTKWSPLHREYGSTSSIDQHGIATSTGVSGNSFFEMLMSYQGEKQDQRSPAPERLAELLMASHKQDLLDSGEDVRDGPASNRLRDKQPKRRSKSETGGESIFRKLRSVRAEVDSPRVGANAEDGRLEDPKPLLKPWMCQKGFAHYDVQSTLFNLNEVIQNRQNSAALCKNTTSGASAASAFSASATSTLSSTHSLPYSSPGGSQEELSARDSPSFDAVDDEGNGLVLSCPCFRTETGGDIRHKFGLSLPADVGGGSSRVHGIDDPTVNSHCNNAGVAVVEGPKDAPSVLNDKDKQYIIEHVDLGAYYYRKFFYLREHWNYFGLDKALGPVAVSIRREKLEEHKEHGQQYNYRIIFRTSELTTLRGSILEDSVPSSAKHGTTRGLPLKEVLDYLLPELDISCLRLALNTPKVTEQLMKLDEQGLSFQVKVGIMYCRAGQSTEEEMYNNETAGPAFEEFLQLLGEKVRLKGFTKYRAQLDTKTDSTGTHSLYTAYKDYEIMFHVSTMLPYTPNNKQQLLRKRHIGNDIITIVFQEPGAHPFTPKNIRSHFQHVFIIVRVHNPCSDNTCYSVAVSRSGDVPSFGPAIPKDVTLPKSTVFGDFLLTKLINAENAAHKSDKFGAMATRTRQEYLRDLAERHVTSNPVESSGKFPFKSLAHKKKERSRPYGGAELRSLGAITWAVHVEDQTAGAEREGLLAISNEFVLILDQEAKALVFNCSVRDVIGWSSGSPASMKIYYERGENVSLRSINNNTEDFSEVVKRLELVTKGSQTKEMTLRRNALGQLGFQVNFEGIVAEMEPYGYAWQAGLRQGSRLVEICKVAVATLSHEQMIDLLRTSVTVRVVIIPPHDDSTPRRYSPGSDNYALACSIVMGRSPHTRNSPNNQSYSSVSSSSSTHWRQKSVPDGYNANRSSPLISERQTMKDGVRVPPTWARVVEGEGSSRSSANEYPNTRIFGSSPNQHCSVLTLFDLVFILQNDSTSISQSSSNTLSSNASSSAHSDEKWYEISGRTAAQPESDLNGFTVTYLQGASADGLAEAPPYGSGTRSSDCVTVSITAKPREKASAQWGEVTSAAEITPSASDSPLQSDAPQDRTRSPPAPDPNSHTLSDVASHSSTLSSAHSGSPLSSTQEESAPSASSPTHPSLSPGPKSFYPRQGATSKYLIGWKKPGSTINSVDFGNSCKRHQSDGHLGGQPQLRATMRVNLSPQHAPRSNIEEDLKKLITLDSPPPTCSKPSFSSSTPFPRSLQCTFSDESIFSVQREPLSAGQSDGLFGHSTMPRSPTNRSAPLRQNSYTQGAKSLVKTLGLVGKVSELESMVKLLQDNLQKEKDAKASLQAEVQNLRADNQRLQEESHNASAKLKKFTEWVFNTIDMTRFPRRRAIQTVQTRS